MKSFRAVALALAAMAAGASAVFAGWPNQSIVNLPVTTYGYGQSNPVIASDGAGGCYIAWQDLHSGVSTDIYAQHVLASGLVDPAWPVNGRAVCAQPFAQQSPAIVADGLGGAIIVWQDDRTGGAVFKAYAMRVVASGLDPAWPADGRALSTISTGITAPSLATDGAGGAIVAWAEVRGATSGDIYVQHVLLSGAVDPAWPADGRLLCAATGMQWYPVTASDGAGGAIVAWTDQRTGTADIYAGHVLANGFADGFWPADGRALCTATNAQQNAVIVADGAGGAVVAWVDSRAGATSDIYAARVMPMGMTDPVWPLDGRALCTASGNQSGAAIAGDGAGGALVAWSDGRAGTGSLHVYVSHIQATGVVDAAWPADGRSTNTATSHQQTPVVVADGAGGALLAWDDNRNGPRDIYTQHVLASGAVDTAWPVDGRPATTASSEQSLPAAVTDGSGGLLIAWNDYRSGTGYTDIYAQRVARHGYLGTPEAELAGVKDVPNDEGGRVKLSWVASYLEFDPYAATVTYNVFRSVPAHVAAQLAARGAHVRAADAGLLEPGDLVAVPAGASTLYWEFLAAVPSLGMPGYSYVAPTTGDSAAAGNPRTLFTVQTRVATQYWNAAPDSGYSVDNLAPAAPAPFTGAYAAGTTLLAWEPNAEPDVAGYRIYRGASASFTPSTASLLAEPSGTSFADAAGAPYVYKLTAIDVHGNESAVATLLPNGTAAVGDVATPRALALSPASPNPARGGTVLRFVLPADSRATLAIYDAAGRLVRTLADGDRPAGEHATTWDLRDGAGRGVGAGLYFARLEAGGRTLVRRIAVTP